MPAMPPNGRLDNIAIEHADAARRATREQTSPAASVGRTRPPSGNCAKHTVDDGDQHAVADERNVRRRRPENGIEH